MKPTRTHSRCRSAGPARATPSRGDSFVPGTPFPAGQTIQLVAKTLPYPGAGQVSSCHTSDTFTLNNVAFNTVGLNYDNVIYPISMPVNGVQPPEPAQAFAGTEAALPIPDGYMGALVYIGEAEISDIAHNSNSGEEKNGEVLGRLEEDYGNTEHAVGVTLGTAYGVTNSVPGSASVVNGSGSRPLTSVAHEISHQFGLVHASNCNGGGENGQKSESWPPDERGELNGIALNTTSEPYKFIYNGAEGIPLAYDYMSYCAQVGGGDPNDWLSPRNWEQLVQNFGITPNASGARLVATGATLPSREPGASPPLGAGAPASEASLRPGAGPVAALATLNTSQLRVIGFSTLHGVHITNVGPPIGSVVSAGAVDPSYTLTAVGAGGRVVASVPMKATTGGHVDGNGLIAMLSGTVPSAGVDALQVSVDGKVMATRSRPARAPVVRVTSPRSGTRVGKGKRVTVRWHATNPEHLALTAAVDYSHDGGRKWQTIFVGPDRGHASISSFLFSASRNARVRVRVNDGFNESIAISKRFTALGAPPKVDILSRFSRKTALAGDAQLQLAGLAVDPGGKVLSGKSLHWYDGSNSLGYGFAISAGPLPPGINHIRLVARGSSGRSASTSEQVTVAAVKLPGLTLDFPSHVSRHARKLKFSASATTATTLTIGHHTYQLSSKLTAFTLAIKTGRTPTLLTVTVASEGVVTPLAVEVLRR